MRSSPRGLPRTTGIRKECGARSRRGRDLAVKRDWIALEERWLMATFLVTNTLDDLNPGSLRYAIVQVNADPGTPADAIKFKIPGTGPFTISPASSLPTITHPVLIDGYSQPGAKANTQLASDDAVIQVDLNGAGSGGADGLTLSAGASTIRGLAIGQFSNGIHITGAGNDVVSGDFIGTDTFGRSAQANYQGVLVDGSAGNTIGGRTAAARDLVSANTNQNIYLSNGSRDNLVAGNFVGLDTSGLTVVPGYAYANGILAYASPGNTIGGTSPTTRNVVSGQSSYGIYDGLSGSTLIVGNYVGTDASGSVALPNQGGGIFLSGAPRDTVGGAAAGAGNLVSGNAANGIVLGGLDLAQGNYVGTDATGTHALGNAQAGIDVTGAGNTVGGVTKGSGNLVSGNAFGISFAYASGSLALGNRVGTDASGSAPLGNAGDGILFGNQSSGSTAGGTAAGSGNTIAFNGGPGIGVDAPYQPQAGAAILGNSIHDNGGLGIDLNRDGVTPNSPGGAYSGPNLVENYPVIAAAVAYNGKTVIKGTLNSTPNAIFTIQYYGSPAPDPSGYGEGQSYLGSATATTDGAGNASFQTSLTPAAPAGQIISATATDSKGFTSEFSADAAVVALTTPLYAVGDSYLVDLSTALYVGPPGVLANDVAVNGGSITAALVSGPSHGALSLNADGSFDYNPTPGYVGSDSFTYKDVQGSTSSNAATVTISVRPKTFTVINTNDSGPGSLRQAILDANLATSTPPDTIKFKISGAGPFTISPSSALPTLTHPTIVDGYTQPGASPNTLPQGDNAVILIQIDGANADGADGLVVAGGNSTIRGLSITRFADAIHLRGNGLDLIAGDFLGVGSSGTSAPGNTGDGVFVDGVASVTIGGTGVSARDILSGNAVAGLASTNAQGLMVLGSFLGTDITGAVALGNGYGIDLTNSPGATIGGSATGAGDLISGNQNNGIFAGGPADGLLIQGDFIGTDITGTRAIGNGGGLDLGMGNVTVGGRTPDARNVISGNSGDGLHLYASAGDVLLQGNYFGTDITGTRALGNSGDGLSLDNPTNVTIGGTASGAGNVVSANGGSGLGIFNVGTGPILIQGNFVGTDRSGTVALGNQYHGLYVTGTNVSIGGTATGAGNVISANGQDGINLSNSVGYSTTPHIVQGNHIGTDGTGAVALGNAGHGVFLGFQTSGDLIGGTARGAGNVIAYNGLAGVGIISNYLSSDRNTILSNSIHDNGGLGIDLNDDGVTPDTTGGPHGGPNQLQGFPVLSAAIDFRTSGTAIQGAFAGLPGYAYTLQFFGNFAPDPSGYGEGQTLLGQITVTPDAGGNAHFVFRTKATVAAGQYVSATATDSGGNTSEFSADVQVVASSTPIFAADDAYATDLNATLVVAAPGVQANDFAADGKAASSTVVTGPSHGSLVLNADGSFEYTPATGYLGPDSFTYRDVRGSVSSNVATVTIAVGPIVLVVTNTNDSGPGSLRQAMLTADASTIASAPTIEFDIPGGVGPFVITPATALPAITRPMVIDATTQPGWSPNTLAQGDNEAFAVVLSGASGNVDGLVVTGGGVTIRGLAIVHFANAIHLQGLGGDLIAGNTLGIAPSGVVAGNGGDGIFIDNSAGNTIGGTAPADRNLIGGNGTYGLYIDGAGAAGELIQGNYIGTTPSGISSFANGIDGIQANDGASGITIGGTAAGAGNLLAGNAVSGIALLGSNASDDLIQGNLIGVDATGAVSLGNGNNGIYLSTSGNVIGGASADAANVISSNGRYGVVLQNGQADSNVVQGNFIGTDPSGTKALGNGLWGVGLYYGPSGNTIGGATAGAGNIIANNMAGGIDFYSGASGNFVQGDVIRGNLGNGVEFLYGSSSNTIGGAAAGAGNTISGNSTNGVLVGAYSSDFSVGDVLLSDAIFGNTALGIDLGNDGVTLNTPGGPHFGANYLQNFPVLSSATTSGSGTTIAGTLNAAPNTPYTIQIFSDPTADPSGYGQGQTFLGSTVATTDASGNASFSITLATAVPEGQVVSATATDPAGNTSEFALDIAVAGGQALTVRHLPATPPVSIIGGLIPIVAVAPPLDEQTLGDIALDVARLRNKREHQGLHK